ncbi:hypothetical protein HC931_11010 [Candidatus Gracilibacteria bacterium]|jgi:hypothetical protein|nr:hypothetical protein [Candidatus Gracilibacteria bacterium]NJM86216.1 hypothetical protein [Hydrococcus sp. RU_2_2]
MVRKVILWLLWIGFIFYILFLAPPIHWQATLTLLKNLVKLQLSEINPIITSLFALIGVCLFMYSCVLFFDGRMQKIPFYPFAIAVYLSMPSAGTLQHSLGTGNLISTTGIDRDRHTHRSR